MIPRGRSGRANSGRRKVVPLVTDTKPGEGQGAGDWVAWLYLTLGILCGAGALYFALQAI